MQTGRIAIAANAESRDRLSPVPKVELIIKRRLARTDKIPMSAAGKYDRQAAAELFTLGSNGKT